MNRSSDGVKLDEELCKTDPQRRHGRKEGKRGEFERNGVAVSSPLVPSVQQPRG